MSANEAELSRVRQASLTATEILRLLDMVERRDRAIECLRDAMTNVLTDQTAVFHTNNNVNAYARQALTRAQAILSEGQE